MPRTQVDEDYLVLDDETKDVLDDAVIAAVDSVNEALQTIKAASRTMSAEQKKALADRLAKARAKKPKAKKDDESDSAPDESDEDPAEEASETPDEEAAEDDENYGEGYPDAKSKKKKGMKYPAPVAASKRPIRAHAMQEPYDREWFNDPKFTEPTPLTVSADGHRVAGHIGLHRIAHIGRSDFTPLPSGDLDYSLFHRQPLPTTAGPVLTGPLCLASGHLQDDEAPVLAAQRHYDNPKFVTARGCVGEDEHGVWFAGAILPHVPAEDVVLLASSDVSGDWRPTDLGGRIRRELVGICGAAVPGFPVVALAASGAQNDPNKALFGGGAFSRNELWRLPYQELKAEVAALQSTVKILRPLAASALRSRLSKVEK